MKKTLLFLMTLVLCVVLVGCGSKGPKKKASYDDLLKIYVKGMEEEDIDKTLSVMPDFMKSMYREELGEDPFGSLIKNYGKNYKVSYKIVSVEDIDSETVDEGNEWLKEEFTDVVEMKQCKALKVRFMIEGSKDSDSSLEYVAYCDFDGTYRLVIDY